MGWNFWVWFGVWAHGLVILVLASQAVLLQMKWLRFSDFQGKGFWGSFWLLWQCLFSSQHIVTAECAHLVSQSLLTLDTNAPRGKLCWETVKSRLDQQATDPGYELEGFSWVRLQVFNIWQKWLKGGGVYFGSQFKGARSVVVGTVPGYGIWSSLGPWLCYTVGLVAKQLAGLEARPACVQRPTSAITSPLRESTSWEPNVSNVQANGDGG